MLSAGPSSPAVEAEPVAEPEPEPVAEPESEPESEPEAEPEGGEAVPFFGEDTTKTAGDASSSAPPMPEVEELPNRHEDSTQPEVEGDEEKKGGWLDGVVDRSPDRGPAGTEGGAFFDPGKLEDTGPSGGQVQIRGFIAADFFVTERTDTRHRNDDGTLSKLDPLAYFNLRSAALYVGAPIFADVVYARVGLEFVSLPATNRNNATSNFDIISQGRKFLFFESGALEINPFAFAKKAPKWFSQGFKLTAGVFILPFGIEDEEHAAPVNWFITRALSMSNGRVYPGTWNDAGATLKWKPTFRDEKPIRPIELDLGVINGDACTATRFQDQLFSQTGLVARCERQVRPGEYGSAASDVPGTSHIDAPGGFVLPDNNAAKSVVARAQFFPLPAINVGGSFVWGRHPDVTDNPPPGQTTIESPQADSWRAGAHLDVNFDEIFSSPYPLPHLRGEFIYGVDAAADLSPVVVVDRKMTGGYAQVAQPLFRRKKSRMPGLILQYRFDHADPDLAVPGSNNGIPLASDNSSAIYLRETASQTHTFGLRLPVVPRFTLKAEYRISLEDGGPRNQLHNNLFGLEAVADF